MSTPDQKKNKWTTLGATNWVAPPPRPTGLAGTRFNPGVSKSAPNRSPAQGFYPDPKDMSLVEEAHAALDRHELKILREAYANTNPDRDPREAQHDLPSDYNWQIPLFNPNATRSGRIPPASRLEAAMKRDGALPRRRSMSEDSRGLRDQLVQLWKEVDEKDGMIRNLVTDNMKLREELMTERALRMGGSAFTVDQLQEMDRQAALAEVKRRHRAELDEVERAFGRQPSPFETPGSYGLPLDLGPRGAGRGPSLFPPRGYVYPLEKPGRRPEDLGNPFG